jgi:hypothetical protein
MDFVVVLAVALVVAVAAWVVAAAAEHQADLRLEAAVAPLGLATDAG